MIAFLSLLLHVVVSLFKTKARLEAEIVLLRHQLNVLRRRVPSNPKLAVADRLLFVWLYRLFPAVLNAVTIVQPETVIRWHRRGFRLYWRWKSHSRGGRPKIPGEIRRLIREMSLANRLWGAPRIHGELLKLGIELAQSTVAKYMARSGRGRSQTWKTFLHNHTAGIGAMDFLIVPTVGFRLLFVLVILGHERRRLISLSCGDGHQRSPDGPAVTVAERACGETDRLDPPGVPRSYRRLRRGPFAPDPLGLRRLLQRFPDAPILGQRYAEPSADPTARPARCSADPRRTSSSLLPDIVSGRHNPICLSTTVWIGFLAGTGVAFEVCGSTNK
jgi:hypothetical protein